MQPASELLTKHLLQKKQAQYLYQSLGISVLSIFFAVSLSLYIFWSLAEVKEQLLHWYFICLFTLSLRLLTLIFYNSAPADSKPQLWIYLFMIGACLNAAILSLFIFLIPLNQAHYYTYTLLLISTVSVASITSLGIHKQVFFSYLASLSIPICIFFFIHSGDIQSIYLLIYLIIFLFS
ncbi:MAG: hypothetical protein KAI17_22380, partial [Thiotrichaceae bacterium]|nr:hypothetical protein [Thiotrichaceae bacterium]